MKLDIFTKEGASAGRTMNVSDKVFAADVNEHAVYLAVKAQRTNARQGTRSTKTRSMVAGGGRKPWRQKGRGTARAGTIRSPLWKGGGIIFGPQPNDFNYKLPKKVKKLARISALSAKAKEDNVKVLENFTLEQPKTREMFSILKSLKLDGSKTLVLVPEYDRNMLLAGRNIKNLKIEIATDVSTYDLLNYKTILIMEDAVGKLEGILQ